MIKAISGEFRTEVSRSHVLIYDPLGKMVIYTDHLSALDLARRILEQCEEARQAQIQWHMAEAARYEALKPVTKGAGE